MQYDLNLSTPITTLKPFDYIDAAYGGTGCLDADANYAARGAPFYNVNRPINVFALGCGVNDWTAGHSEASTYAALLSVVAKAKATGYLVTVATVTDSQHINQDSGGAGETWRAALNTDIRNGAVANGYTVWDVGGDANLGCNGCYANATYFTDGIHFTAAGQVIQTGYLKTALQSLGFQ